MQLEGKLHTFPKQLKLFIGAFVLVLSVGFYTGLFFVDQTGSTDPVGLEENYLGNEEDEDAVVTKFKKDGSEMAAMEEDEEATVMKFKKGEREILTITHTHILSMSFIFFLLGGILYTTQLHPGLKTFLMIEPFFSLIATFGGIYLMWTGISWIKYVVIISGTLMTATFTVSSLIILAQLIRKNP